MVRSMHSHKFCLLRSVYDWLKCAHFSFMHMEDPEMRNFMISYVARMRYRSEFFNTGGGPDLERCREE